MGEYATGRTLAMHLRLHEAVFDKGEDFNWVLLEATPQHNHDKVQKTAI